MSQIRIATRREFLAQGLGIIGVGASLPNFLVQTALAGPNANPGQKILVVIQLSGGHDSISAVVPFASDDYASARRTTRIQPNEVIKINDEVGLHPNLKGFKDLLDQQAFAAVPGIGYPNPNRSHFTAMDNFHRGNNSNLPATSTTNGWLGRYVDQAFPSNLDPVLTLAIGAEKAPRAIQGRAHPGLSLARPESFRYLGDRGVPRLSEAYRRFNQSAAEGASPDSSLAFVARTAVDANACSDAILRMAAQRRSNVTYPTNSSLATSLQTVASLIAGGLGTRVYYVFQGGYDTHAGQRVRHDRLMTELSDAVVAFQRDLTQQNNANRVLSISFSEFGRTFRENNSQGTDHGTAGAMLLFGPALKPGVYGRIPGLAQADRVESGGEMRHTTDFRSVYATVLEKWLNTNSQQILGGNFPLLNFLG